MIQDFSKDFKPVRVSNAVAASQTTLNTGIVDMGAPQAVGGFDAVCFLVALNTMVATSALTATVQDNSLNQTAGMTAVTASTASIYQSNSANATVVQSASNAGIVFTDVGGLSSNQIFLVDCLLPQQRYVRLNITIATANAAFDGIFAILYRTKFKPVTQDPTLGGYGLFIATS